MATHSNIFAWRIPWTGEPGGLQSVGLQRVEHNGNDFAHVHFYYSPRLETGYPGFLPTSHCLQQDL